MAEYITSHDAKFDKQGRAYIPQCMRTMLPAGIKKMFASIEQRAAGTCIALYTQPDHSISPKEVSITKDCYVSITDICEKAEITPPFRWQATSQMPGNSIDCLILWQVKDLEVPKEKSEEFAKFLRSGLYGSKKKTI
jgi:hypothetical protein